MVALVILTSLGFAPFVWVLLTKAPSVSKGRDWELDETDGAETAVMPVMTMRELVRRSK